MKKMIKKVIAVNHHRNGIGGTGFSVVLFIDRSTKEKFVGIVVDDDKNPWNSIVLSVDRLTEDDIAFGSNSWRGDNYVEELKRAIMASEGRS
jgi:hypothetical protein